MRNKKRIIILSLCILLIIGIAGGGYFFKESKKASVQSNNPKVTKVDADKETPKKVKVKKKKIHITAVGDSLTYGVGDSTKSGGYVSLISDKVAYAYNVKTTSQNFGKSGDTSQQIDQRVRKQKKIQNGLRNADVITVTCGGNDLMHVLMHKGMKLHKDDVEKGRDKYYKSVDKLMKDIRKYNTDAPIYLISVYNPFFVYFQKVRNATKSVQAWNEVGNKVMNKTYLGYFVDVNNELSHGPQKKEKDGSVVNSLLYNKDHFHPNDKGYKLMTNKLYQTMNSTKDEWLYTYTYK